MGNQWSTQFIPDKCEVIGTTKQTSTIVYPYKEHNIDLKTTKNVRKKGKKKRNIKEKANKTCLRSQLEYCNTVLHPMGKIIGI